MPCAIHNEGDKGDRAKDIAASLGTMKNALASGGSNNSDNDSNNDSNNKPSP